MSRADAQSLMNLMDELRLLVRRPGNNYHWSSWDGPDDALRELDAIEKQLAGGAIPIRALRMLFAATGSLQELSVSSGWGSEFLRLAARFDAIVG
jgi:hypothetical protein